MRLVTRDKIDHERWNHVVQNSPQFRHYALSYFLDACTPTWSALIWGNYDVVWPLPMKTKLVKRVFQPLLAQQLGPISIDKNVSDYALEGLGFLNKNFKTYNVKFGDSILDLEGCETNGHLNVELDLSQGYSKVLKGYNRNAKSNIKKSEKAGLIIEQANDHYQYVIDVFRSSPRADNAILNDTFYKDVASIYLSFLEREEARCYLAKYQDNPIAGILILTSGNRMLNFFTASTPQSRQVGGMHALVDYVIKNASKNHTVFDFEGSDDDSLRFFYKSFGGDEKVYLQTESNRLLWPINKIIK